MFWRKKAKEEPKEKQAKYLCKIHGEIIFPQAGVLYVKDYGNVTDRFCWLCFKEFMDKSFGVTLIND